MQGDLPWGLCLRAPGWWAGWVEPGRVLAAFDAEVRRSVRPDGSGALIEADCHVVRWVGVGDRGWSGIAWSGLDEADADGVIAEQVACFAARGEKFEWKLYDYDRPPGLARRLAAVGFVAEGQESLLVAEVSAVPAEVALPPGVRLLPVTDEAGVGLLIEVHERVFGTDHSRLRRSLLAQLRDCPEVTAMVVAMAGDQPVCSARIEFLPGTSFASLWGGGTLPAGAAGESTAPWSPTAPNWPPPAATATCMWTHPPRASPSWPASGSATWPAPHLISGIPARRYEPGSPRD
jgi:hypothetical protein